MVYFYTDLAPLFIVCYYSLLLRATLFIV